MEGAKSVSIQQADGSTPVAQHRTASHPYYMNLQPKTSQRSGYSYSGSWVVQLLGSAHTDSCQYSTDVSQSSEIHTHTAVKDGHHHSRPVLQDEDVKI